MKKMIALILGGFFLAIIIVSLLTQKTKKPTFPATGVTNNAPTKVTSPQIQLTLKTYTNPSGFSFQYPESFILTEKKINDQSIYAWVELTHPQNKDVISIKLEDSALKEIDNWFTASGKKGIKGEIKKVKLADLDGRQFTDKENQTTTLALDKGGVLISILGNPLSVHQQIVSSFIFTQPPQTTINTSGDGGGDVIFEGEEVIQ